MKLRVSRAGWLVLATVLFVVGATVFHFWREYRRVQDLVADVERMGGAIDLQYQHPEGLVAWAQQHGFESSILWLKTDVTRISFESGLGTSGIQPINDAWLGQVLARCDLQTLLLRGNPITDQGLRLLASQKNLTTLSLAGSRITDAGMESLKLLSHLYRLDLSETQIDDGGGLAFESLSELTDLNLADTRIGDAVLGHLSSCKLRILRLKGTAITDAGLASLKSQTELELLDIRETSITDAGLESLRSLTNLKELWLHQTRITDAGLSSLKSLSYLESLELDIPRAAENDAWICLL